MIAIYFHFRLNSINSSAKQWSMRLSILAETYGVCRLSPTAPTPDWCQTSDQTLVSITKTCEELSIVCPDRLIPSGVQCEKSWKAIKVCGELDFGQIGIICSLSAPLAHNSIPVFIISTFNTDYILVKQQYIDRTKSILQQNGHQFCWTVSSRMA